MVILLAKVTLGFKQNGAGEETVKFRPTASRAGESPAPPGVSQLMGATRPNAGRHQEPIFASQALFSLVIASPAVSPTAAKHTKISRPKIPRHGMPGYTGAPEMPKKPQEEP